MSSNGRKSVSGNQAQIYSYEASNRVALVARQLTTATVHCRRAEFEIAFGVSLIALSVDELRG